ncbi:MAG: LysR family transcriptional regulator [Myxococcus sp.]|nr:LysR family transcriptional regulator [Myxococcus sp.]
MTWLNHHHLEYFRLIAREGGLSAAARRLGITHSTLSIQLKQLEAALGDALFDRKGRQLVLTAFGEQVLTYAEAIHRLGAELMDFAEGRGSPQQRRPFRVSATASLPRTIVMELMAPLLTSGRWGPVEIRQTDAQTVLGDLVSGRIHLALSDDLLVRPGVHSHLLGSSGVTWYAMPALATRLRQKFPTRLAGQGFVLPSAGVPLRRALDRWLVEHARGFRVVAEVDDAAMLRVLGSQGLGVFPVRDALKAEVEDLLRAQPVGPIRGVTERYYALTMERTVRDEGVAVVVGAARTRLARER